MHFVRYYCGMNLHQFLYFDDFDADFSDVFFNNVYTAYICWIVCCRKFFKNSLYLLIKILLNILTVSLLLYKDNCWCKLTKQTCNRTTYWLRKTLSANAAPELLPNKIKLNFANVLRHICLYVDVSVRWIPVRVLQDI